MKSNLIIFLAELVGTFGLLVAATGSIVFDGRVEGMLGPIFIAGMHFIGLAILVQAFGKYSMAHFNPAVTIGFYLSGYIKAKQIPVYLCAQTIGAFLGTFFVKYIIGDYSNLGLNYPNLSFPFSIIFPVEIIATIFLMGVILLVVHIKRLNKFAALSIGAIIALDVYFLGPISGASMNPIRSLSPAVVLGMLDDLWIYWSSPFIGSAIVALIYKKIIQSKTQNQ